MGSWVHDKVHVKSLDFFEPCAKAAKNVETEVTTKVTPRRTTFNIELVVQGRRISQLMFRPFGGEVFHKYFPSTLRRGHPDSDKE